jgi:ATP-binding cassette subfamily C protein CydC
MSYYQKLAHLFTPYRTWMWAAAVFSGMTVLANIALLGLSAWFLSAMAVAGISGILINYFTPAGAIRGLALSRIVGRYLERIVSHEATFRLLAALRVFVYQKLEPLAPAIFLRSGDIFSRMRSDIDALDHFFLRVLLPYQVAAAGSLLLLLTLAWFFWPLALLLLLFLWIAGVILPWWNRHAGRANGQTVIAESVASRTQSIDYFQGLAELEVAAAETSWRDQLIGHWQNWEEAQLKLQKQQAVSEALFLFLQQSALLALLIAAVAWLPVSNYSALLVPVFALLALAVFELIAPLPLAMQYWGKTVAAAQRVFALLDQPSPEEKIKSEEENSNSRPENYHLEIKDLSLHYPRQLNKALQEISLIIPEGKKVLITGDSGSGKSSLFNALLQFWPYQGEIYLGERKATDWDVETWRSFFSVVPQEIYLFNSTLRDNLRLAKMEATDEELKQWLSRLQLNHLSLDQAVGEQGKYLSGGEKRRLGIIRALLRPSPIILLDEPLEGLDADNQRLFFQVLAETAASHTWLVISHQPIAYAFDLHLHLAEGRLITPPTANNSEVSVIQNLG